jgi:hypothetical protein
MDGDDRALGGSRRDSRPVPPSSSAVLGALQVQAIHAPGHLSGRSLQLTGQQSGGRCRQLSVWRTSLIDRIG